jgi:predicted RND superfamily exporter protein
VKSSPEELAGRYVAWLRRHVVAVIAAHAVVLALAGYLIAFHLPLFADFSYLLPQDAPAVTDLRRLEKRIKATDTMLVVVQAPTADARAASVRELAHAFRGFPKDLVGDVEDDDVETRDFLRDNKFLFVPLADLQKARDALAKRVSAAKLAANPLYVDLDSDDSKADAAAAQKDLDQLKQQRKDAEAKLDRSSHVSADGKTAMIEVRIAFRTTDIDRGHQLIARLDEVRRKVVASQPGVVIGFTGSIITAVSEHAAIFNGIVLSSIITALLVAMVLALYFRSARLLVLLVVTIAIATAAAFGAAALTVGHLNAATAFLGAIIAGNGVNYGILLIARFLEERRKREVEDALAFAIVGTLRPTAVASLGASIAYGSLAATSFKGFADFAVIGAIGMILCWIASYALLPALVLVFGRRVRVRPQDPWLGHVLVRLLGFESSKLVVACGAVLLVGAGVVVARYVAADPFEYDMKQLRSEGREAAESRHWMKVSDDNFGRGYAGRTFIAADRPEQIPQIIAALHARDAGKPPAQQVIGSISSILDAIPPDQEAKLELLDEIRTMLDKNLDALDGRDPCPAGSNAEGRCGSDDDKDRADLADLRPPDYLRAITRESLPKEIRDKPEVTEADGRIGLMLSIHSANRIDEWNGHDLIEFSSAVRRLDLADGETVTTSGASVIFADIIAAIEHDGPIVTAVAAIGLVVMVLGLVGWNRRAGAVLVATIAGALFMVALCALLDLKVNFLDFIALPITLGIGIDYAINVAHRYLNADTPDVATTLRTSGSAVFVCSMTTMIGYGSLLVSDNLAIRGFGAASLLGEVTCVLTALVLVPALLGLGRRPDRVPVAVARGRAA